MYCPWLRRGWGQVRDCAIGGGAIATTHMVTVNWSFVAFFRVDEPSSLARQRRHRHLPLHHRTNCRKWADRLKGDLTLGRGSGCGNAGQDGARGGLCRRTQKSEYVISRKVVGNERKQGPRDGNWGIHTCIVEQCHGNQPEVYDTTVGDGIRPRRTSPQASMSMIEESEVTHSLFQAAKGVGVYREAWRQMVSHAWPPAELVAGRVGPPV